MTFRTYAGLALDARGIQAVFAEHGRAPRTILEVRQFHVDGGRQVAICGPSGSGKTTLLNLLAGLEQPRRGVLRWGEVEVTALSGRVAERWRRETVGLVFQQSHLFPGLSAVENVLLPMRFDRWTVEPGVRGRALKLLDRVGVCPDDDVAGLSRGEQQRVAVARALLRKPAIVLADEPTASLDHDTANVVVDLLSSMCRSVNATLVLATHDPHVAGALDQVFAIIDRDLHAQSPAGAFGHLRSAA